MFRKIGKIAFCARIFDLPCLGKFALGSAFVVLVIHAVVGLRFRWQITIGAFVTDLILLTYFALCFLRFQKRRLLGSGLFTLITVGLFLGADLKYVFHQDWLRISEFLLIEELLSVFPPVLSVTAVLFVVIVIMGVIANFQRRFFLRNLLLLLPIIVFWVASFLSPTSVLTFMETIHEYKEWEGNNYFQKGVLFALFYDIPRTLALQAKFETIKKQLSPFDSVQGDGHGERSRTMLTTSFTLYHSQNTQPLLVVSPMIKKRNIHIFVMESFMDPVQMGLQLPTDPLDPRMRKWIGGSALSPSYGGATAQAEFEILCGAPVYELADTIVFNNLHGGPIACLPYALEQIGYTTISTVAARRSFFNYGKAYQSMGFSKRIFEDSFPGKDRDGIWISDDEHVALNKETITPLLQNHAPILNYMLTSSGHIEYQLNKQKRPRVITTLFDDQITQMINNLYYNSRSIGEYVEYLLTHDPTSIIVVIGDHQGHLANFDPTEHHPPDSNEAEALSNKYKVPYIFLDAGKKTEFSLIAHYEIPHLILASLKGEQYRRITQHYGVEIIRPLFSKTLYVSEGVFGWCPAPNDANCSQIAVFQESSIARLVGMIEQSHTGK